MRRRRRKAGMDAVGYALLALGFLAMAGLATAGFMLRPPPTDPETLCRTDLPLRAHTLILVDATDALEPRHRRRLQAVVDQERARLAPYDRLTIARLRPARPSDPELLFSLCAPRAGADANPLFENPKMLQRRWDDAFGAAMTRALRRASAANRAGASPIASGVRAIAADVSFTSAIPDRRFVLVSDLLEHNPHGFSLYVENVDYAAFIASRDGAAGPPDLTNVSVRVVTLDRDGKAATQARARDVFWAPYFDAAGARSVEFDAAP